MPRGPAHFRQRDLTAAVKAVENAGKKVSKVVVDIEGSINIYVGGGNTATKHVSEWDKHNDDEERKARLHQKL